MGIEPPPNVMRADAMRKGQIRGRVKTGAKTATKDQEREYLARFKALGEDPSPLVPEWRGTGRDPLASLRRRLAKISQRRESGFWLKWHARGKGLPAAYAQTLLVLKGGRIPSFASLRFHGRDVRFVLRGRGLRDALVAVQNHEDTDVRLLGFIRTAKSHRLTVVSTADAFFAVPHGTPLDPELARSILEEAGLDTTADGTSLRCPHESTLLLAHQMEDVGLDVAWCHACADRAGMPAPRLLEGSVLVPGGSLKDERTIRGEPYAAHPASAQAELAKLLQRAGEGAQVKEKRYTEVTDADRLTWAAEALQAELDARADGFLLLGNELWLGDFDQAAQKLGSSDVERRALAAAFRAKAPKVRASDRSLNRLLAGAWPDHGSAILEDLAGGALDAEDLAPLARQRPSEALAGLERLLADEQRLAGFPRFGPLPPPLRLAHDLFRSHHVGDDSRFQRRLSEGVRDEATKPLALALARAFGRGAGVEWQYAPHEKDRALFFDPAAREFAAATPAAYADALARLADALELEPPHAAG